MANDLKTKSLVAVFWSSVDAFSRQGIQFLITIFLARLLDPEEFGTLAMLTLFTGVATIFIDGGFSSALIQKKEISEADTSSIFFFNIAAGAFMGILLAWSAPWIAAFFKTPLLVPLTRMMAMNLFLTTFGSVHNALLARDLDFRTQTRITLAASVISGTVSVFLAWQGWGVWSLAIQILTATLVSTILLWMLRPWRPSMTFKLAALRSMGRFGGYMFSASMLETLYSRFYALIIGKFYSARTLGFFTRADTTQQIPTQLLSTVVNRVMYPVFASVSGDRQLLLRGLRKSLVSLMLINVPVLLGLMAASHSFVTVLFGPKWQPCVPYLQVLCLSGVMWPLHVANLNILKSMGRSDLFFRVEVAKKVLGFSALLVTVMISVLAMAWSRVLLSLVCFGINGYYTGVLLAYPPLQQLRDIAPCLAAGSFMALAVWLTGHILPLSPLSILAIQILVGITSYISICRLFRISIFMEFIGHAKARLIAWRASPSL